LARLNSNKARHSRSIKIFSLLIRNALIRKTVFLFIKQERIIVDFIIFSTYV